MKGVKHYLRNGTVHNGGMHKMSDGTLHTGKTCLLYTSPSPRDVEEWRFGGGWG